MENFLLILAVVGGIIYKIYENYQEEMEKARQRKTKMRPPTTTDTTPQHWEETVYTPPQQEVTELPEPMVVVYEEPQSIQKKTEETTRKDIKNIRNRLDDIRVKPTASGQRAHEAAARRLEIDRERRLAAQGITENKKLEVINLDKFDFDLRNAVIQSAILERPYKD